MELQALGTHLQSSPELWATSEKGRHFPQTLQKSSEQDLTFNMLHFASAPDKADA